MVEHGIKANAEHYTCMVNLVGCAGLSDNAKEIIDRILVEPKVSTWGALLGGRRIHKDSLWDGSQLISFFNWNPIIQHITSW